MSSLRVETLRLCWLETFLVVAEEENISEAANVLGIDQSTVSRYMQRLEKWSGKKLIEPGRITDPENPRVSVGLTEDGLVFHAKAERIVADVIKLRSEAAVKEEIASSASGVVLNMQADLKRRNVLDVTASIRENIETFQNLLATFDADTPMDYLVAINRSLRTFFNRYEVERNRERRWRKAVRKAGSSGRDIRIFDGSGAGKGLAT